MTTQKPLATLRSQGIETDFFSCRLRVWPRPKITKAICDFITANLSAIVDDLRQQGHGVSEPDLLENQFNALKDVRCSDGIFMWELPEPQRSEMGGREVDMRDSIYPQLNGQYYFVGQAQ